MNKIGNLLNIGTWLLHNERASSGLDYLSRIDGEEAAWYFWLHDVSGVYELKLDKITTENGRENSTFFLRYYPDIEEDTFEDFSCQEQILRMGELFDQGMVNIPENAEVCPCCGGKFEAHHDHCHEHVENVPRPKGIPNLIFRRQLPKELFQIGLISFTFRGDAIVKVQISTQDRYLSYAEDGVKITDALGQEHELVEPGGVDRNVAGLELSHRFHYFLVNKLLRVLELNVSEEFVEETDGIIIYNYTDNIKNKSTSEVKKIIITNIVRKGDL